MKENEVQPVTDRTIHHTVNFHPEDYEILDYLDNQPPRAEEFFSSLACFPGAAAAAAEEYRRAREQWQATIKYYFPHQNRECNIHHCTHCGNGMVRYIVAVHHKPTGQNVVFGSDCVARLNFANQDAFKLAQVKARAETGNKRMAAYVARVKFLEANPGFKAAIESVNLEDPIHARNDFARDILSKFAHYGSISPRQMECFVSSLQRDRDYAAKKAAEATEVKGALPVGKRQEFTGTIVSSRVQESQYGEQIKILVKLENNCKIWMTCPSAALVEGMVAKGNRYTFRATVEASKDDPHFGFGSRPHVVKDFANDNKEK
jgi:hypothetical protein